MRCDLHVHTLHSGMCDIPGLRKVCRESYSPPEQVYARLKRQGMDLVTVTDHDSIDAAEPLRRHADFFLSEEVTCRLPGGGVLHLGVYAITERDHVEMQRRGGDFLALAAYLRERRLFFSANHVFSSLTGPRTAGDFAWLAALAPAFETLNGAIPARNNSYAQRFAAWHGKSALGGSDAHALPSAGSAYTAVPGARTKDEFLDGLRAGRGIARGGSGGYFKLTRDVFLIAAGMLRERPWTAALAPLALGIPLVTFGNLLREEIFGRYWMMRLTNEKSPWSLRGRPQTEPAL
jgi:predicted metal-dependent phosphoesterase TrpH